MSAQFSKPEETALYFGSVRFFKHLIATVIFLIIAGLLTTVIFLTVGNSDKLNEIERLNSEKNTLQALNDFSGGGIDDILQILDALGIDNKELVNTIYENDRDAFGDIVETERNGADSEPDNNGSSVNPPVPEPNTEPEPDLDKEQNPYAELFPHLYVNFQPPTVYMNDADYIYLTFDDGPSRYTVDILRYLDKHDIKATFFVIPDDTENGRNFLNTMLNSGHEIGVHTMTHIYEQIYASVEAFLDDFNRAFNLIYEQTGYRPYLYRFPGGSKNDYNEAVRDDIIAEMARRGFVYYDWNVDSRDAMDANWTQMYNSVLNDIANQPRSVVLFHDRPGGYNTVTVIEDIIKALLASPRGYTFSAITPETRPIQF
ncbi:MAG: polysaccharide deacetylase [Oscillospiraceae bacterium]|jgi:peptidoglycan/xylan/chitin deacetylase (PgdA/CDA1 family)|nr:polysaccharide deacetylase [Oscillospiraceae bacterium]